jgi:hypothetical protein
MNNAREAGYQAFLLYPATIKLTRATEQLTFQNITMAECFIASWDSTAMKINYLKIIQ